MQEKSMVIYLTICSYVNVPKKHMYSERDLAELAKQCRVKSRKTKAEAARELGVTRATIQEAEEDPDASLTKLRIRMIETYSSANIVGPLFLMQRRTSPSKTHNI